MTVPHLVPEKQLLLEPCLRIASGRLFAMALLAASSTYPAQAARHHRDNLLAPSRPMTTRFVHHIATPRRPILRSKARLLEVHQTLCRQPDEIAPKVIKAVRAAQQNADADPFVLLAIAWKESRLDPLARNKHSSAQGLLQFTATTWLTVVRDFGARHGLTHYAHAIKTDRTGRLAVATPNLRRKILALRNDSDLEAIMAAERLAQTRVALEAGLGRAARPADLYVVHLLGPTGAKTFLKQLAAKPDSSSIETVGSVAQPNLGLFVDKGRTLSVAEVYANIEATLSEQAKLRSTLFDPMKS